MTEKRYIEGVKGFDDYDAWDNETEHGLSHSEVVNELNRLSEENEQLKQAYQTLKHRHSLLHDECLEAECDRDSLKKDVISLEKENEQLKEELGSFEQVNFTDLYDGSRTVLYMKKENVGDVE